MVQPLLHRDRSLGDAVDERAVNTRGDSVSVVTPGSVGGRANSIHADSRDASIRGIVLGRLRDTIKD